MTRLLSFNLGSRQTSKSKSKLSDLGFLELSSGQDPIVDIVAIHGLDGHREASWTAEDGTMWLRDLLPNDIPNARILTYGYDADTRSFAQTSTQTIFQHAEAFAEDLTRQRKSHPERPMIFLAHSLGGIILKRALAHCHGHNFDSTHDLRDIIASTLAVLFFGTPHSGANGVELAEWMQRLLSIYMSTNNTVLKDLNRDSSVLEELQTLYLPASQRIDTIFFYEEYPTPIAGGLAKMIVPRHLAIIAGDSRARVVVLHADHCQMVKCTGKEDPNYRKVIGYLSELLEKGIAKVQDNWVRENGYRSIAAGKTAPIQQVVLPKPLLPVSGNYVQRPQIDNFLTEKLLPPGAVQRQLRCVLHGLGGGGKTQLASSWIEANKHKFSRIFIVDASTRQQIEADLETGIRSIGPQYYKSTWKDAVSYLCGETSWLLLFDNADSPSLRLDDYLPTSIRGAVLITTRNRECIGYAPNSHFAVGKLTEEEAVDLLHKVANFTPATIDASLAIVKELGMWALAITQAGAYIFKTRRFDTYLATFQKHRDKLMREAPQKGINYEWSIYTSFGLSFEQLTTKAQDLLKICSFLHFFSIPLSLFERSTSSGFRAHTFEEECPPPHDETILSALERVLGSEWDEYSFQGHIDSISRGSLLDTSTNSSGETFYNLHPLVQAYVQDLVLPEDRDHYAHLAGQLLLGAIRPLMKGDNTSWYRQLSLHIDSLPTNVKLAHPSHALAFQTVYVTIESWNACLELQEYCYSQFLQLFGPRHSATISVMLNYAPTLHHCDQLEEAEKMGREVLELLQEEARQDRPDGAVALGNLASILHDRGQLEEAERMREEVARLQLENLGPDDPDTIFAYIKLALTLCDRGQSEEAEALQRAILKWQLEHLGPRHPDTILSMGNLATTLNIRGELEAAEKIEREVLALRMEIFGPQNFATLLAMANLASTLRGRDQLEEAEKMQRQVLTLRLAIWGPNDADTILAAGNLASTLSDLDRLEEAEKMERKVLKLRIQTVGERHADTFLAMGNLASTLYLLGHLDEAAKLQRKVLAWKKKKFGARHLDTLEAMGNLASTLHYLGQLKRAEEMEREVLASRTSILGAQHPDTIIAKDNLARTLKTLAGRKKKVQKGS